MKIDVWRPEGAGYLGAGGIFNSYCKEYGRQVYKKITGKDNDVKMYIFEKEYEKPKFTKKEDAIAFADMILNKYFTQDGEKILKFDSSELPDDIVKELNHYGECNGYSDEGTKMKKTGNYYFIVVDKDCKEEDRFHHFLRDTYEHLVIVAKKEIKLFDSLEEAENGLI
jgi:hypothetical protein